MSLWQAVKLLLSLEKPIQDAVVQVVNAIKRGDSGAARIALESALRVQFELRQELR